MGKGSFQEPPGEGEYEEAGFSGSPAASGLFAPPPSEEDFEKAGFRAGGGRIAKEEGLDPFTDDFAKRKGMGVLLGLNGAEFGTGLASDEAIFDDLDALGVSFLRAASNEAQLLWPDGVAVPVDPEDIFTELVNNRSDLLERLFEQAERTGIKVVLRFLVNALPWGKEDPPDDPHPTGPALDNPMKLQWAAEHRRNTIDGMTIWGDVPDNDENWPWVGSVLDTRIPYKLHYVRLIARECAFLLLFLEMYGVSVWRNVLAIEIFNEINTVNIASPLVNGAAPWGDAVIAAVQGFVDMLGADLPALWWPSLAQWRDPGQTFEEIVEFDAALIERVTSDLSVAGLLSNQDYHWYHYLDGRPSLLTAEEEVEGLRGLLPAGCTVSVCETSTPDDGTGAPLSYDEASFGLYQAREVWQRLCTFLCAGTRFVGWHTLYGSTQRRNSRGLPTGALQSSCPPVADSEGSSVAACSRTAW